MKPQRPLWALWFVGNADYGAPLLRRLRWASAAKIPPATVQQIMVTAAEMPIIVVVTGLIPPPGPSTAAARPIVPARPSPSPRSAPLSRLRARSAKGIVKATSRAVTTAGVCDGLQAIISLVAR